MPFLDFSARAKQDRIQELYKRISTVVAKLQTLKVGEILKIFEKFKPKSNGNPSNVFRQRFEGPDTGPGKKCRLKTADFFKPVQTQPNLNIFDS